MMSQMIVQLDTLESGVYFNGESVCIAICNMARLHADTVSLFGSFYVSISLNTFLHTNTKQLTALKTSCLHFGKVVN